MENVRFIDLNCYEDERGALVPLIDKDVLPFEVKRMYFIRDNKNNIPRAKLAHKSLEQVLLCINGSCKVLLDDGSLKKEIELNQFNKPLYISNNLWREVFDFSLDCVLLSLNSEYHNESELIRNYNDFLIHRGVTQ